MRLDLKIVCTTHAKTQPSENGHRMFPLEHTPAKLSWVVLPLSICYLRETIMKGPALIASFQPDLTLLGHCQAKINNLPYLQAPDHGAIVR